MRRTAIDSRKPTRSWSIDSCGARRTGAVPGEHRSTSRKRQPRYERRHARFKPIFVASAGSAGVCRHRHARRHRGACGRGAERAAGSSGPVLVAAGSRDRHVDGEGRAAARPQSIEPVAVTRDQLLGLAGAWTCRGGLHRVGRRMVAVHAADGRTQPVASHRLQRGVADSDRFSGGPAAPRDDRRPARRRSRRCFRRPR